MTSRPAIEDRDAVADALDVGEDVGRDDDRRRAAEALDQREQVAPALRVERADRLVEDEQLGLVEHGLGDAEPLAHPAGVRPDPPFGGVAEAGPRERRRDPRPQAPTPDQAGQSADQLEQLAALHPAVEPRVLVEVADAAAGRRAGRRGRRSRRPTPTPLLARARPVRIRIVVVLPAPFGPSRPKTEPRGTSRSSESSARTDPNRFVSPRVRIAGSAPAPGGAGHASSRPTAK